jgi:sarcosine/dimethylglycine N-methyltransferase
MMTCMDWARPVSATSTVLDLGSGHGGSTHAMVERFGCRVKCVACVRSLGLRG